VVTELYRVMQNMSDMSLVEMVFLLPLGTYQTFTKLIK
jgi:hypothetical protein